MFNRTEDNSNHNVHVDNVIEIIQSIFHEIAKKFNRFGMSVSLEELLGRYNEAIDMIILHEEETKNCQYLSGEFKISCIDNEHYECSYSLYFEDAEDKFHALEAHTKSLEIKHLTEDFQNELRKDNYIKFDVSNPSSASREKYESQKNTSTRLITQEKNSERQ